MTMKMSTEITLMRLEDEVVKVDTKNANPVVKSDEESDTINQDNVTEHLA